MKLFKKAQLKKIKAAYEAQRIDMLKQPPKGMEEFYEVRLKEIDAILLLCQHAILVDEFIPWEIIDPSPETLVLMDLISSIPDQEDGR